MEIKKDAYVKKMKTLYCLFEKTSLFLKAQVAVGNVVLVDCIFLGI
jgi:hypothetical protein